MTEQTEVYLVTRKEVQSQTYFLVHTLNIKKMLVGIPNSFTNVTDLKGMNEFSLFGEKIKCFYPIFQDNKYAM